MWWCPHQLDLNIVAWKKNHDNTFFEFFSKKVKKSEILANEGLRERYHSNLSACGIIDRNEWDRPLPKKWQKNPQLFWICIYMDKIGLVNLVDGSLMWNWSTKPVTKRFETKLSVCPNFLQLMADISSEEGKHAKNFSSRWWKTNFRHRQI